MAINPNGISPDVEFKTTSQQLAARAADPATATLERLQLACIPATADEQDYAGVTK